MARFGSSCSTDSRIDFRDRAIEAVHDIGDALVSFEGLAALFAETLQPAA